MNQDLRCAVICAMTFHLLIFNFTLFIGLSAWAQFEPFDRTCMPRDYRPALGPSRDQGDLGWCFAYSSADLLTQKLGFVVSAADLATAFHLNNAKELSELANPAVQNYFRQHPDFMMRLKKTRWEGQGRLDPNNILSLKGLADSGGDEEMTLLLANVTGVCAERQFPSNPDFVMAMMREAFDAHARQSQNQGSPVRRVQTDVTSPIRDPISVGMSDFYLKDAHQLCGRRTFLPYTLIPYTAHVAESENEYREGLRTGRFHVTREGYAMVAEVHRALDSGRIAAIGYGTDAIMPPDGQDDDHSSVIVARKNLNGTCHYLVRNTWGNNCSIYKPEYRAVCENGGVWLTTTELAQTVYSVTVLE